MTLPEMLADLPYACDIGVKRDAKGYNVGYRKKSRLTRSEAIGRRIPTIS